MTDKLLGLMGIARRSGHLQIGFDAVADLLKKGRARQILLASDCSEKTEKELRFARGDTPCPITRLSADKAAFAAALGSQKPVAAVATDDSGFAAAMQKHSGMDTKEDVTL